MKRPTLLNKWPLALALSASLAGACSGEDSATETDPATAGVAEQLQAELDAAVPLNANTVSAVKAVRPILKCVEKVSSSTYKAHFGFQNSSSQSISVPLGFFNRFWPNPINRGQPTTFAPGTQADVVQVSFNANSAVAWILGIHFDIASRFSRACPATGGTGGSGTGGHGTGGAGTGGAGTGGHAGTGGAGTGGSGTGGHGTGGAGTGGSGTGGHGTGGAGTGGAGTGGRVGTGGAGTGGAGTGGSGTGGSGQCPSTCDDRNPCTVDTCSALTGFQCSNVPGPDGVSCSDGNACTIGDVCMAGVCTMGTPRSCAASDQCHAAGVCDTTTGACSNPTAPNGAACNDNNACTGASSCQAGVCTGTQPTVCQPSDQCHVAGTCDPTSGTCSNPTAANGTTCSDSNACTTGDSCQSGACSPGTPKTCTSAGVCRGVGTCDPASGVCSNPAAPNGTTCDDGNLCTTGESCVSGACSGGAVKTCAAAGVCHAAGICQPATGTCTDPLAADGTTCDDGNACSTGDACHAGVCTATTTVGADECVSSDCAQCTNDNGVPFTINGCSLITDPTDKALCEAAYSCFRDNASVCVSNGDPLKCWCGTNQVTCNTSNTPPTQANGVCLAAVMAAAKSTDASTIKLRFVDPNFPLGRAVNMTLCRGSFCGAGSGPDGVSSLCPPF